METQSRALRAEYIAEMKVVERAVERLSADVSLMTGRRGDLRMLTMRHHLFALSGKTSAGWSALHGLDFRDPMSDRRLIEWCLGVPDRLFRIGGERRGLARRAMQGRLPDEVLHKPIDSGRQGADWHARLSRDLERIRAEFDRFAQDPELAAMLDLDRLNGFLADWPAQTPISHADPRFAIRNDVPNALSIGRFVLDTA
jgi:asparagine synthase (glutamine-hydrolysing)